MEGVFGFGSCDAKVEHKSIIGWMQCKLVSYSQPGCNALNRLTVVYLESEQCLHLFHILMTDSHACARFVMRVQSRFFFYVANQRKRRCRKAQSILGSFPRSVFNFRVCKRELLMGTRQDEIRLQVFFPTRRLVWNVRFPQTCVYWEPHIYLQV